MSRVFVALCTVLMLPACASSKAAGGGNASPEASAAEPAMEVEQPTNGGGVLADLSGEPVHTETPLDSGVDDSALGGLVAGKPQGSTLAQAPGTGRGGGGPGEQALGLEPSSEPAPSIRISKATVSGALDERIIGRVARRHYKEVKGCYEEGFAKNASLSGTVTIGFTITPEAKVGRVAVESTTVADSDVGKCIADAVATWSFFRPTDGKEVTVKLPFVLEVLRPAGG